MFIPPADFLPRNHELDRRLVNGSDNVLILGDDPDVLLDAWIIIYTVGQVLLLLLIGTLWKKRESRSWKGLTLMNMLITMVLNSATFCILFYAGQQTNPNPSTGLCLAQATLKHGSGPMTEVAILSLGVEVFLSLRASIRGSKQSTRVSILLLGAPYASFIVWSIPIAVMGVHHPENIERLTRVYWYYCSYRNDIFGDMTTTFGILAILATAVIQSLTARILQRSWRSTRQMRASGGIDFSLIVRICVFVALQILFIILTAISMIYQSNSTAFNFGGFVNIFQSLVPIIAFIIFGFRSSILEVWFGRWWHPSTFIASIASISFTSPHPMAESGPRNIPSTSTTPIASTVPHPKPDMWPSNNLELGMGLDGGAEARCSPETKVADLV